MGPRLPEMDTGDRPITVIFTPTCQYGGLGETYSCLINQTTHDYLIWIIADELYNERKSIVKEKTKHIHTVHMKVLKEAENWRNLARSYNVALEMARDTYQASLFISLQDYIWIPPNAIRKMRLTSAQFPDHLITGRMNIYKEPSADRIINRKGLWTIFGKPYLRKPNGDYWWKDVRPDFGMRYIEGVALGWEQNWAAISSNPLHDRRLWYDEKYDKGVAYENCDFAMQAEELGYKTLMDCENEAYGFPHKVYFPEREAADIPHLNTQMFHERWDIPLSEVTNV